MDDRRSFDRYPMSQEFWNRFEQAPSCDPDLEEHLCLDKGYDSKNVRELVEVVYQYTAHIRSRGEEQRELDKDSGERPRRWVVERTHSWLNRVRAVRIRWEKKIQNHIATLHLVCA